MATVDLAAFCLVQRLAPEAEVTLYTFGSISRNTYQPGELPYAYLDVEAHRERFFNSDIFIFWGDFTHTRTYWHLERFAHEAADLYDAPADVQEAWKQSHFDRYSPYIFLTPLAEERLKDVIVFGSTIITNEAKDQLDERYHEHFTRFFRGAGAVYFRDALSAAKISPLRGNEASLGCDCALLLKEDDVRRIPGFVPAEQRQGVGVFFGRSPSKSKMMLFSRLVGRALGEHCTWLPWFTWYPASLKELAKVRLLGYKPSRKDMEVGMLLSALSGYRYIVTDTYHLCVNAWRMGVPAICIGQGAGISTTSLADKKKEILYEMYGARQFYVFLEWFQSIRSRRTVTQFRAEAVRAAATLANEALAGQVRATIAQHQAMAEKRLGDALRARLAAR